MCCCILPSFIINEYNKWSRPAIAKCRLPVAESRKTDASYCSPQDEKDTSCTFGRNVLCWIYKVCMTGDELYVYFCWQQIKGFGHAGGQHRFDGYCCRSFVAAQWRIPWKACWLSQLYDDFFLKAVRVLSDSVGRPSKHMQMIWSFIDPMNHRFSPISKKKPRTFIGSTLPVRRPMRWCSISGLGICIPCISRTILSPKPFLPYWRNSITIGHSARK